MKNMDYKIAYVHRTSFPSTEANTFDSIWSAAALAEKVHTTFFVPRLKSSLRYLKSYYEILDSSLPVRSMHLGIFPDRFLIHLKNPYETFLSNYFRYHPLWRSFQGKKILYVREPMELLYWGLKREKFKWMKNWIFCYEAHDTLGLDPQIFYDAGRGVNIDRVRDEKEILSLTAAQNFDLMLCNTQTLVDDMKAWSNGTLDPKLLTLASPLPRVTHPVKVIFGEKIIIGYIGTVDKLRGADILLEAMRLLPEKYVLRIVGRFRQEPGIDPNWLKEYLEDPKLKSKLDINLVTQINDVANEIDRCDILIQPASTDLFDERYTAPLKSYGYMVRGKPIIAGDVISHRELFDDGEAALLYKLTPDDLARQIEYAGSHPGITERIAQSAWQNSDYYSFKRKVKDLLSMFDAIK